jgi:hypothetical protein
MLTIFTNFFHLANPAAAAAADAASNFSPSPDPPASSGVLALSAPGKATTPPRVELYSKVYVGGKGANLLVLRRCGVNVPAFLLLPVAECERALLRAEERTGKTMRQWLAGQGGGHELREALLADALSEEAAAMVRAFVGGGSDRQRAFAVRSSANVEDGSDSAFAGQFETFLNVHTAESVAAAVRKCWASLLGEAVLPFYQRSAVARPLMAVVVMEQVDSAVAGVYFEANPVSGATSTHCVSAAPGQGEGVVSGKVPADEFWLSAKTGAVRRRIVAENKTQRVALAEVNDGTREEPLPAELRSGACLSDAQLAVLHGAVRKLARAYKSPQDVEFAFDKSGTLFVLQARPITTRCERMAWDPPDVGLWRLNAHCARPMSAVYAPIWCKGWGEGCLQNSQLTGSGFVAVDTCALNGFGYFCMRFPGPRKPPTAPPPKLLMRAILRLTGGKDTRRAKAFWHGEGEDAQGGGFVRFCRAFDDELKPQWIAKHRALQSEAVDRMTEAELADYARRCHAHLQAAWFAHVTYTLQQMLPAAHFTLTARQWTGCSPIEAFACLEGCSPVSEGLHGEFPAEIRALAQAAPARELLARGPSAAASPAQALAELLALAPEQGGDAARRIVRDNEFRLVEGYDPANGILKENPGLMLSALRSAVERVASVPAAAAGGWQEAAGAVRARVPAPRQAEFDALLAQTRGVMHLRDERAIYTDLWAGILHRAMLACASRVEKLRAAGKEHLVCWPGGGVGANPPGHLCLGLGRHAGGAAGGAGQRAGAGGAGQVGCAPRAPRVGVYPRRARTHRGRGRGDHPRALPQQVAGALHRHAARLRGPVCGPRGRGQGLGQQKNALRAGRGQGRGGGTGARGQERRGLRQGRQGGHHRHRVALLPDQPHPALRRGHRVRLWRHAQPCGRVRARGQHPLRHRRARGHRAH